MQAAVNNKCSPDAGQGTGNSPWYIGKPCEVRRESRRPCRQSQMGRLDKHPGRGFDFRIFLSIANDNAAVIDKFSIKRFPGIDGNPALRTKNSWNVTFGDGIKRIVRQSSCRSDGQPIDEK